MEKLCSYVNYSNLFQSRGSDWANLPSTDDDEWYFELVQANCPYCDAEMHTVTSLQKGRSADHTEACAQCGWWRRKKSTVGGQDSAQVHLTIGVAQRYEVGDIDVPLADLRRYIEHRPFNSKYVHPSVFERLICDCLRSAYPESEVVHVGQTGDGGVDAHLITKSDGTHLVQVKRREDLARKEGVTVVRELNGVLFREGLAKGMIISNAVGYTRGAHKETDIKTQLPSRYEMKLLAFDDIVEMLQIPRLEPYHPWKNAKDNVNVQQLHTLG